MQPALARCNPNLISSLPGSWSRICCVLIYYVSYSIFSYEKFYKLVQGGMNVYLIDVCTKMVEYSMLLVLLAWE